MLRIEAHASRSLKMLSCTSMYASSEAAKPASSSAARMPSDTVDFPAEDLSPATRRRSESEGAIVRLRPLHRDLTKL